MENNWWKPKQHHMILSPLSDHLTVVIETGVEQQMQFFTLPQLWTLQPRRNRRNSWRLWKKRKLSSNWSRKEVSMSKIELFGVFLSNFLNNCFELSNVHMFLCEAPYRNKSSFAWNSSEMTSPEVTLILFAQFEEQCTVNLVCSITSTHHHISLLPSLLNFNDVHMVVSDSTHFHTWSTIVKRSFLGSIAWLLCGLWTVDSGKLSQGTSVVISREQFSIKIYHPWASLEKINWAPVVTMRLKDHNLSVPPLILL